jgi:Uma2 family endonuclease
MTLLPPAGRTKLTVEEYSNLPDVIGFIDELIEGERVFTPIPRHFHGIVLDNLGALLKEQFPQMRIVRGLGWSFKTGDGLDNVLGPDLMVIRPEVYSDAAASDGYFESQPQFVVEVVSPTERISRRMQKVGLYLEAGAEAVVEVDYTKRCAFVFEPEEYAPQVIRDLITTPFTANLSDIFSQSPSR